MIVDLNFKFKSLDGEEIAQEKTAAKLVADILCGATKEFGPVKAYELALKLNKEGKVELDTTDLDNLKKVIENTEGLVNLAKAQVLLACKEKQEAA